MIPAVSSSRMHCDTLPTRKPSCSFNSPRSFELNEKLQILVAKALLTQLCKGALSRRWHVVLSGSAEGERSTAPATDHFRNSSTKYYDLALSGVPRKGAVFKNIHLLCQGVPSLPLISVSRISSHGFGIPSSLEHSLGYLVTRREHHAGDKIT